MFRPARPEAIIEHLSGQYQQKASKDKRADSTAETRSTLVTKT